MPIILIGGGGNSKKIIDMLVSQKKEIFGVLDDKYDDIKIPFYKQTQIIGRIEDVQKYKQMQIFITIGSIQFRKVFIETYPYLQYPNLIHEKAYVSPTATLGIGIIIHFGVYIGSDVSLHDFCHIDTNTTIEHDCVLGQNVMVCPLVSICGNCRIKNNVFIGSGTTVNNSTHEKEISIGNNCLIGSGSLITKKIDDGLLWFGTPKNITIKKSPFL